MTRHEHFARYWSPAREATAPQSEAEIREQNARRAADQ